MKYNININCCIFSGGVRQVFDFQQTLGLTALDPVFEEFTILYIYLYLHAATYWFNQQKITKNMQVAETMFELFSGWFHNKKCAWIYSSV